MKNLIAFIFVILMIIIDNDIRINQILNFSSNNTKIEKFTSYKEDILWIYNPIEISDREWINFGSRRSIQPNYPIIELCNESVKFYLGAKFKIYIFNDLQLEKLIPEYLDNISKVKNKYMHYNLIKYAILYKYGGFWINNDILMINNIDDVDSENICFYQMNENGDLYSDNILYVNKNNNIIKKVLNYIIYRLHTFQNTDGYFNSITKYLNSLIDSNTFISFKDTCLTHDLSGRKMDFSVYLNSYYNNMCESKKYSFFPLNLIEARKSVDFRFITKLSKSELQDSPMFISTLINYAFNKKPDLIHIGIINQY